MAFNKFPAAFKKKDMKADKKAGTKENSKSDMKKDAKMMPMFGKKRK
jgi:hypothetical protein